MPIETCNAPSTARRFGERSLSRATRALPTARPVKKVVNIALHIGRRPIFAFGNSDGDLAMLRYTLGGPGPCMGWYIHHDDDVREFAYDRDFRLSPFHEGLDRAAELGIGVASMRNDWRNVFVEDGNGHA